MMKEACNYSNWVTLLISSGSKKEKEPSWEFFLPFGGKFGRREMVESFRKLNTLLVR
jgi:hypothetical protein